MYYYKFYITLEVQLELRVENLEHPHGQDWNCSNIKFNLNVIHNFVLLNMQMDRRTHKALIL
jgi:hypothetical protein